MNGVRQRAAKTDPTLTSTQTAIRGNSNRRDSCPLVEKRCRERGPQWSDLSFTASRANAHGSVCDQAIILRSPRHAP